MTLQERDEEILAMILAGARGDGRPIVRANKNLFGDDVPTGPVCAVGAGILYTGMSRECGAIEFFADKFNVSYGYAWGVSDGFEGVGRFSGEFLFESDYNDGWQVGLTVYAACNT